MHSTVVFVRPTDEILYQNLMKFDILNTINVEVVHAAQLQGAYKVTDKKGRWVIIRGVHMCNTFPTCHH